MPSNEWNFARKENSRRRRRKRTRNEAQVRKNKRKKVIHRVTKKAKRILNKQNEKSRMEYLERIDAELGLTRKVTDKWKCNVFVFFNERNKFMLIFSSFLRQDEKPLSFQ